ncbi:hypothetical protein NNJEOMEG_01075 [Fundidesulfovibrio magnetotacticus]|uniref:Uncharacterized protein n=1 Tax=Fundidesulfovibrio magnetotacticus TaxID=2730080 RepID=A0A6V8LNI3_9BACT|nr:hypothetical protein [Fundidesulfovibrio magnetotacticus]GFK93244.1 hypothetical protein NNJEOMEG_01075 [Fundidesulfovibrio magnetotacticus]
MGRLGCGIAGAALAALMPLCEALAEERKACRQFRVTFQTELAAPPGKVMLGKRQVGVVEGASGGRELAVCIDARFAGEMERNTFCFVSGDELMIYNVWSTGEDLPEGSSVPGFATRWGAALHEAKEMGAAFLGKLLELLRRVLGNG